MPSASATYAPPAAIERAGRIAPAVGAFAAGAAPVVLLGFSRGGYPVEVVAGYGVALWWLLLVGLLTGALPRPRPTRAGWVVLGSLAALTIWGLWSLTWSQNEEAGLTEVVRLVVAGGSLLLGMSAVRGGHARVFMGGVFAGLCLIVGAAALSRLQPELIAGSSTTNDVLNTNTRTSWPLNYWNAIGAAGSVATGLGVVLAAHARTAWASALSAAPLPVVILGTVFTLSRGGLLATGVALVAAVILVASRPVLLRTLLAPGIGAAVLILAAYRSEAIANATGTAAQSSDGRAVLMLAFLVIVGVLLVQAGWATADRAAWTPKLPRTGRLATVIICTALVLGVGGGAIAAGASGQIADRWRAFKVPTVGVGSNGAGGFTTERFVSVSSNHRYEMWSGAVDAFEGDPVKGIGLGSWESWWSPRRGTSGFVRNAHSEGFELLAETGAVGASLFAVLLLVPIGAGIWAVRRRSRFAPDAVLVVPALAAFAVALLIDWNWQIGAFMVAGVGLCAVALSVASDRDRDERTIPATSGRNWAVRARTGAHALGIAVAALVSIAVLAVALVAPQAVDASRDAAARGDFTTAAREAADAAASVGFAASPALQLALVQEQAGRLPAAEAAARAAAARAPEDWRPWFVVARIAAARGRTNAAVAAYRRARALNPNSPLLAAP
jgi:hypothetical protein